VKKTIKLHFSAFYYVIYRNLLCKFIYIAVCYYKLLFINYVKNCCISPLRSLHDEQQPCTICLLSLVSIARVVFHLECGQTQKVADGTNHPIHAVATVSVGKTMSLLPSFRNAGCNVRSLSKLTRL